MTCWRIIYQTYLSSHQQQVILSHNHLKSIFGKVMFIYPLFILLKSLVDIKMPFLTSDLAERAAEIINKYNTRLL